MTSLRPLRWQALTLALLLTLCVAQGATAQSLQHLEIVSPRVGETVTVARPGLVWRVPSGVTSYRVWVDGTLDQPEGSYYTCPHDPCDVHSIKRLLTDGRHTVQVRGYGTGSFEPVAESEEREFFVAVPPTAALSATPSQVLTGDVVKLDASQSTDNGSLQRFEWDLDGDGQYERNTNGEARTETSFSTAGDRTLGVRVTDNSGYTGTATVRVAVAPRPPAGPVGISVNDGAQFTNDPQVLVYAVWPAFARTMLFSNDGGFRNGQTFGVSETQPWTLDSSGPERLPKTVYVRFGDSTQTFQDDIILDQTPPILSVVEEVALGGRAAAAGRYLELKADDATSGVDRIELSDDGKTVSRSTRFAKRLRVTKTPTAVRVRDRAGNASSWRRPRNPALVGVANPTARRPVVIGSPRRAAMLRHGLGIKVRCTKACRVSTDLRAVRRTGKARRIAVHRARSKPRTKVVAVHIRPTATLRRQLRSVNVKAVLVRVLVRTGAIRRVVTRRIRL